jgi:cytohesin
MELPEVVFEDDVAGIKAALDAGLDPNAEDGHGNSPLTAACSRGHIAAARLLIASGADVNRSTRLGPPLKLALFEMMGGNSGRVREIVRLLLNAGADPNVADPAGQTPFLFACTEGWWDLAETFLQAGANVNHANRMGTTALIHACKSQKLADIQRLLAAGADANACGITGETPLLAACSLADRKPKNVLARVRLLLQAGARPDAAYRHLKDTLCDDLHPRGTTALMLAAAAGCQAVVDALLQAGANVALRNRKGQIALTLAARQGHAEIVARLRQAGATEEFDVSRFQAAALVKAAAEGNIDRLCELLEAGVPATTVDPANRDLPALHWAVQGGHAEAVRLLLEAGADVQSRPHYSALVAAAGAGHEEIVRDLLAAGADIHFRQCDGAAALSAAARCNHLAVVQLLLEAGAAQGDDAGNALDHAAAEGHGEVIAALLEAGVRPSGAALVAAARRRNLAVVRMLLAAGCDPNAPQDEFGRTPLMEAVAHCGPPPQPRKNRQGAAKPAVHPHREVIDLLLAAGADINARVSGSTALHCAVFSGGGPALIGRLVEAGADPNAGDYEGATPLMAVLHTNQQPGSDRLAKLKALLDAGANPSTRDLLGQTALHRAGRCSGSEPEVRVLLAAGADPSARDQFGRTPLMLVAGVAASYKNLPAVRTLIEAGADVNARDSGNMTVLAHAAQARSACGEAAAQVVEVLRQAGAKEEGLREEELRQAAAAGSRERVLALLAAGANANAATWGDDYSCRPSLTAFEPPVRTPLTSAVAGGHLELVRDLLSAGARVDLASVSDGHPGISLVASAVGHSAELVRALLAAGADARTPDAFGRSPLLYAARARNRAVVDVLLEAGVPVDELAGDFLPVLDFSAGAGRPEYQRAVAELAVACATEPIPVEGLPGVTCFQVESRKAARQMQAANPDLHRLTAEVLAHDQALDEVRSRFHERLLAEGLTLAQVSFSRFGGSALGLFPTDDPFAVVAAVGPYTRDDPFFAIDLLRDLHAFAARCPFRLLGCGATWMSVEVDRSEPPVYHWFVFEPVQGQPGRWRGSASWFDD